jgi:hypothetical protein
VKEMGKREELELLKENWLKDPCYDIELTEGFEEFRHELYLFRIKKEKEWDLLFERQKEADRNNNYEMFNKIFSESVGYSDRFLMAQVFKYLVDKIETLEEKIKIIEGE